MPAEVHLLLGLPRSGKTGVLLSQYRRRLHTQPLGTCLWLAPSSRAAAEVRQRLAAQSDRAVLAPGISTFSRLAGELLDRFGVTARPLTEPFKRELLERIVTEMAEQGRLSYFGPIAGRQGLIDLLADFISEMKRLEIWPEQLAEACRGGIEGDDSSPQQRRGRRSSVEGKHAELIEVYSRYQQLLAQFDLYDSEGRLWLARDCLRRAIETTRPGGGAAEQSKRKSPISTAAGDRSPRDWPMCVRFVVVDGFTDFTRTQFEMLDVLAQAAETLWISLPLESPILRHDLFRKPLATLNELHRRFPHVQIHSCEPSEPIGGSRAETSASGKPRAVQKESETSSPAPETGSAIVSAAESEQASPTSATTPGARPLCDAPPVLSHLQRWLFAPPRLQVPAPTGSNGLTIIAAARARGELEAVAGRVKQLLLSGVPADEIAVVFRLAPGDDSPVAEVFASFGIPFFAERGAALGGSGAMKFLVRFLAAAAELGAWSTAEFRSLLGNSYFRPAWNWWTPAAAAAVSRALARARQADSPQQLLVTLRGFVAAAEGSVDANNVDANTAAGKQPPNAAAADAADDDDRDDERITVQAADAAWALKALEAVLDLWNRLPREADARGWRSAFEQLAETVGLNAACDDPPVLIRSPAVDDAAAWKQFLSAWDDRARLEARLGRADRVLSRADVVEIVKELLRYERLPPAGNAVGRVRLLSAAGVRGLRVRRLFVAGLTEGAFPTTQRDDRALSPAEYEHLASRGLPLPRRGDQSCDEMLLFYEVLGCAAEHVYLSYPAIDDAARPMNRSAFIDAVEAIFGADVIHTVHQTGLSPIPIDDKPLSFDRWRLKAVAEAIDGRLDLLAALIGSEQDLPSRFARQRTAAADGRTWLEPGTNITEALGVLALRSRLTFTAAEGIIELPQLQAQVARMFSDRRTFSASELEAYAACPFRFLVERVMELQQTAEEGIGGDPAYRGRLAHGTLELFHQRLAEQLKPGQRISEIPLAVWTQLLDESFRDTAARYDRDPPGSIEEITHRIDRSAVRRWLEDYRQQHEEYEAFWAKKADGVIPLPAMFEAGFGFGRSRNPRSATEPLELTHAGRTVRLSGRIDRIDEARRDGKSLIVLIDYKTGKAGFDQAEFERGRALQLPVYSIAACELILADRDAVPIGAGYWQLREGGFLSGKKMLQPYIWEENRLQITDQWESCRARLPQIVVALVERLQHGQFPVYNSDLKCTGRCPWSTLCRIGTIRALEKQWSPLEATDSPSIARQAAGGGTKSPPSAAAKPSGDRRAESDRRKPRR